MKDSCTVKGLVIESYCLARLKYYTTVKAPPKLVCTKSTALRVSLDTPPHVVLSVHTCSSALTNTYMGHSR